jgi:PAS domain S-box-containing protein
MTTPNSPLILRYGIPVLAVLSAIELVTAPVVGRGLVGILFLVVLFSAWYGGVRRGLSSTALITLIALVALYAEGPNGAVRNNLSIALFVPTGILVTALVDSLHSARKEAEERSERARQHQETLKQSERRLHAILENAPTIVYLKDPSGRYTFINCRARTVFHLTEQDGIGKLDHELFPPDIAVKNRENDLRVLDACAPLEVEERLPQGTALRTYLTIRSPVHDPDGHTYSICGMSTDISDRKRVEESLRLADRRKDEFLAMLAHELRNPLGAIRAAVQLIQETDNATDRDWSVDVIDRQTLQLARLIDDLLDVSRISRGKIQLREQLLDLGAVVDRAVDAARTLIEERRHHLDVTFPDGPIQVHADPTRIEQILVNLLTNAAKYTEPGGRISLCARREGADGVIAIKDTGIGIAPEMLPRIFEMFTQLEHSLERSRGGLGIGLTLVRRLVEMHGGTVTATSGGIGRGSEFTVRLPLNPRPANSNYEPTRSSETADPDGATGPIAEHPDVVQPFPHPPTAASFLLQPADFDHNADAVVRARNGT